jgi:hypothetical protein
MKWKSYRRKYSKAIPVTGHGSLQGCEMLKIAHCVDIWLIGCPPYILTMLYPQKYRLVLISVRG